MPRKYRGWVTNCTSPKPSFNEAGADAPEIQGKTGLLLSRRQASMRPGRMPRKYHAFGDTNAGALFQLQ